MANYTRDMTRFLTIVVFLIISSLFCYSISIEGIWKTKGYNLLLDINSKKITVYELTKISCIKINPIYLKLPSFNIQPITNDSIIIEIKNTTYQIIATRIRELPDICKNCEKYKSTNPLINYEVFIQTFIENYAFSKKRNIDWEMIYFQYKQKITPYTTDTELFQIFIEIAEKLNDIHVTLSKDNYHTWHNLNLLPQWIDKNDAIQTEKEISKLAKKRKLKKGRLSQTYENIAFRLYIPVIKKHYLKNQHTTLCNGNIFYGIIRDSVGYICILREDAYIDDAGDDPYLGLLELDKSLDRIIEDLESTTAIILDARFNLGGVDAYSLAITERFAKEKKKVLSKQAYSNGELSPKLNYTVDPKNKSTFQQKHIYFLTSHLTVSGGENLAISMSSIPNVIFVGETTMGALSDVQIRNLPNNWIFTVSNEIFYSYDNRVYEIDGFEPDVSIEMEKKSFENNIDCIIEKTLEIMMTEK